MYRRWLACVSALLLASAMVEAQRCDGGGGGETRLWLSGELNATGHWTASLRLEKDSAVGRPGRKRLQLQLESSSWRCGATRTDALQVTLHSDPYQPERPPTRPWNYPGGSGRPGSDSQGAGEPGNGVSISREVFTVLENGNAEMRCLVKSPAPGANIFLTWARRDGQPLSSNSYQRDGLLVIQRVQKSDEGEYSCLGYEGDSVLFQATARLEVIALPAIHLEPTRQVVQPGDNANITCSATGDQPIRLEWITPNREFPSSVYVRDGLLQFRGIRVTDAGRYVCRATNREGSAESVAEMIVDSRTQQPFSSARDQSVVAG